MFLSSGIDTTAREVSIAASVFRPLKWLDLLDSQKDQFTILGYGKAYPYSSIITVSLENTGGKELITCIASFPS
jgi:hypothetical protein